MESNQINLFKFSFSAPTRDGYSGWGNYVRYIQGTYGEYLTYELTDYVYRNSYLTEVYRGR